MVELWGNLLSLIGSIVSAWIGLILFDAFFPRKKFGKSYCFFVTLGISVFFVFSLFVGSSFGYASKILFEVASYYALLSFIESPAIEMVIKKRYLLNWADTASVYPVTDHIAHKVYILGRSILHEAHP